MTNNDLNQISKLLDKKLTATQTELTASIKAELTASINEKLTATEKRLEKNFEERLNDRLASTERRLKSDITAAIADSESNVIEEIAGFMEVNILPKLEGKTNKSDIDRLERRSDSSADKIGKHDVRLKLIESVPIIAHQIKIKKVK